MRRPVEDPPCPLCATPAAAFHDDEHGTFWRCPTCALVFRDPAQHLDVAAEVARYREHRNALDDPRYLAFLDRLAAPVAERLPPGARGLDFGSGPAPALALLMTRHGFPTASYDPHFLPDASALQATYDFITCSEVFEHLRQPRQVLTQLRDMLRPNGLLAVMTQFRDERRPFASWYYRRDPTHICLYSEPTMRWIAQEMAWDLECLPQGVTIFRRS